MAIDFQVAMNQHQQILAENLANELEQTREIYNQVVREIALLISKVRNFDKELQELDEEDRILFLEDRQRLEAELNSYNDLLQNISAQVESLEDRLSKLFYIVGFVNHNLGKIERRGYYNFNSVEINKLMQDWKDYADNMKLGNILELIKSKVQSASVETGILDQHLSTLPAITRADFDRRMASVLEVAKITEENAVVIQELEYWIRRLDSLDLTKLTQLPDAYGFPSIEDSLKGVLTYKSDLELAEVAFPVSGITLIDLIDVLYSPSQIYPAPRKLTQDELSGLVETLGIQNPTGAETVNFAGILDLLNVGFMINEEGFMALLEDVNQKEYTERVEQVQKSPLFKVKERLNNLRKEELSFAAILLELKALPELREYLRVQVFHNVDLDLLFAGYGVPIPKYDLGGFTVSSSEILELVELIQDLSENELTQLHEYIGRNIDTLSPISSVVIAILIENKINGIDNLARIIEILQQSLAAQMEAEKSLEERIANVLAKGLSEGFESEELEFVFEEMEHTDSSIMQALLAKLLETNFKYVNIRDKDDTNFTSKSLAMLIYYYLYGELNHLPSADQTTVFQKSSIKVLNRYSNEGYSLVNDSTKHSSTASNKFFGDIWIMEKDGKKYLMMNFEKRQ